MARPFKPTKDQLTEARTKRVRDLIADDLLVLFVGINPGLYTAAIGHHFGRPGNRFWPALHRSGFTPRQLSPFEEKELLVYGIGITNLVARTTAAASELNREEIVRGARSLERKVRRRRPRVVAFLGVDAYRKGFGEPGATVGPQGHGLGPSELWVLPNPSGLNAHYQLDEFVSLFGRLRQAVVGTG